MPAWTEQNWDHERDSRKHDTLTRLDPAPFTEAMEVALRVKACPNIHAAAGLIEAFVEAEQARIRLEAVAAGARP